VVNVALSFNQDFGGQLSGIFANYNPGAAQPMDQATRVKEIVSPAKSGGNILTPFFADFQLAYDPCTCNFPSALKVSFTTVLTLKVDLWGKVLGLSTPISAFDNTNGNSIIQYKDYLTSVYSDPGDSFKNKAGIVTYTNIQKAYDDFQAYAQNAAFAESLTNGLKLLTKIISLDLKDNAKAALESAGSLNDYFNSKTGNSFPSVIAGELALTGNAIGDIPVNGNTVSIANPGSQGSSGAPECCGYDPNVPAKNTDYPMYNEVLGTFAVLKTPTATIKKFSTGYGTSAKVLKISSPIQYVLNPATKVNLSNSKIYAAIKVEQTANGTNVDTNYYPYSAIALNQNQLNLSFNYKNVYEGQTKFVSSSPSIPIESIQSLQIEYIDTEPWAGPPPTKYFLTVMLDLEFQSLNKRGNPNRALAVMTYPINITSEVWAQPQQVESFTYGPFPKYNSLGDFTSTTTSNFTVWNDFTLNGSLRAGVGTTVGINAGGTVSMLPGASIGPNVTLKSNVNPMPFDFTLRPMPIGQIDCSVNSYKANTFARVADPTYQENKNGEFEKEFSAFPNPTTGKVTFSYYIEEPSQVRLNLVSTTGSIVATPIDAYHETGPYEVGYDASNLPAGIYIYTLETNKGKETKRLVVIK
jgi:hypothetical protein